MELYEELTSLSFSILKAHIYSSLTQKPQACDSEISYSLNTTVATTDKSLGVHFG